MTESGHGSASNPRRSSTAQVALVGAILALAGVLLVAPAHGGSSGSATLGHVLIEATALYVGYGAVTRVAGPPVRGLLASD